jgi:hypothetical protein
MTAAFSPPDLRPSPLRTALLTSLAKTAILRRPDGTVLRLSLDVLTPSGPFFLTVEPPLMQASSTRAFWTIQAALTWAREVWQIACTQDDAWERGDHAIGLLDGSAEHGEVEA